MTYNRYWLHQDELARQWKTGWPAIWFIMFQSLFVLFIIYMIFSADGPDLASLFTFLVWIGFMYFMISLAIARKWHLPSRSTHLPNDNSRSPLVFTVEKALFENCIRYEIVSVNKRSVMRGIKYTAILFLPEHSLKLFFRKDIFGSALNYKSLQEDNGSSIEKITQLIDHHLDEAEEPVLEDQLIGDLTCSDRESRMNAARYLGLMGSKKGLPHLEAAAESEKDELVALAIQHSIRMING